MRRHQWRQQHWLPVRVGAGTRHGAGTGTGAGAGIGTLRMVGQLLIELHFAASLIQLICRKNCLPVELGNQIWSASCKDKDEKRKTHQGRGGQRANVCLYVVAVSLSVCVCVCFVCVYVPFHSVISIYSRLAIFRTQCLLMLSKGIMSWLTWSRRAPKPNPNPSASASPSPAHWVWGHAWRHVSPSTAMHLLPHRSLTSDVLSAE